MFRKAVFIWLSVSGIAYGYSGYNYQRVLTIDATKVGTHTLTYTDFPVLISTTNVTFSTITGSGGHVANSSGFDIVYSTKSDCSFLLNHDTETYNATTGQILSWVKIPSISSSTNTTLYLCYGNSGITTYQGISTATWSNGYLAVWHLGNGDSTSSGFYLDSSSNSLHGTLVDPDGDTAQAVGQIGNALDFPGSADSDYVTPGSSAILDLSGSFTLSAWIFADSLADDTAHGLLSKLTAGVGGYDLTLDDSPDNNLASRASGVLFSSAEDPSILASGAWVYASATYQPSTSIIIYENGFQTAINTTLIAVSITSSGNNFVIGARGNATPNRGFNGKIDEAHVSNVVRSAGWIRTEYTNQNSPSTFMTIGSETTDVASGGEISPYRRIIISE